MRPLLLAALLVPLIPLAACSVAEEPAPAAPLAATPTATETAEPPAVDPTPGWAVRRTDHADLDGAGRLEEIGYGGEYGPIRLTTTLRSGPIVTTQLRLKVTSWWPEGYPDLDGDGDQEIVLSREWARQRPVVVDLVGDELIDLIPGAHQPLTDGPSAGAEPGTAHDNGWFVRHGRLVSYHSLEAFPLDSHHFDVPDDYRVWVWSWSLEGDWLRARDQGVWCKTGGSTYPVPCTSDDLPALLPAVGSRVSSDRFPGELPPSDCGPSEVSTVPIPGGPGGSDGWLVIGPGCAESSSWEIYVEVDGRWVVAEHPPRPFLGEGIEETARGHDEFRAWVTEDGRLYSSLAPMGSAKRRLWQWTLDGTSLHHDYLGRVCFDPVRDPRRYGPC